MMELSSTENEHKLTICLAVTTVYRSVSDKHVERNAVASIMLYNSTDGNDMKGSVIEPNISIYFFFPPSGVLLPMFCLLVEGECWILVF